MRLERWIRRLSRADHEYDPLRATSLSDSRYLQRLRRSIFIYAAVVLAAAWAYMVATILIDRERVRTHARAELSSFARSLNAHTEAILADGLGSARAAIYHLQSKDGVDHIGAQDALDMLGRDLVSGPYVDALFIATSGRFLVAGRDGYRQEAREVPDWLREAFVARPALLVGAPIPLPRDAAHQAIPVATRLTSEGSIIYAGVWLDINALHRRYTRFMPPDATMGLMTDDGAVLARVASGTLGNQPLLQASNLPQQRKIALAAQEEPVILDLYAPLYGVAMMYAISRPVPAAALLTIVGRSLPSILTPWRERMLTALAMAGVSSALFILLTLLLLHYVSELDRARQALEVANETLEQRVGERTLQLASANTRLAAANEELEAFSAAVSHDLRSPLTTISGQAGLLELKLDRSASPEVRDRLQRIHAGVRRAVEVIEGMLSLARVFRQELASEEVSLSLLVHQCVEEISEQHGGDVECRIQPDVTVTADPRLMKSLLFNLVSNAWKYSVGRPQVEIEFSCERRDDASVYCVRDHGVGFDMAYAGHLFQPFRRLHSATDFPGTGVGLAVVARIVHRYDGKAWACSSPGEGAAFYFTLPLAQPAPGGKATPSG